ncbi:MAG: hypothetical protein PWQ96_2104 [Clostridia bacterium]|nr:TraR/DksA family transcriptional regulator [Clostridiales bacterium]MDK2986460.1 hypothetical protein [Clostridia bacterium]
MDQRTLQYYKNRLHSMKNRLQELNQGIRQGGLREPLSGSISELSLYDNHPGDIASEVFERGKDLALEDNARLQIQKIDDALRAIEEGTYGICDVCGQPINPERLQVMPESTQCVRCREEEESVLDRHLRPIEEDVIRPLYGDNNPEDIQFDGEDTWQKVANWSEHAEESNAGAYYGGDTDLDEINSTDQMDNIPYFQGADGIHYEDVYGLDDEGPPKEKLVGKKGADRLLH